jgi:hypothetical protein
VAARGRFRAGNGRLFATTTVREKLSTADAGRRARAATAEDDRACSFRHLAERDDRLAGAFGMLGGDWWR